MNDSSIENLTDEFTNKCNVDEERVKNFIKNRNAKIIQEKYKEYKKFIKIKNRGTGAGGSNTNKNGLSYENKKDISTEYNIINKNENHTIIKFKKNDKEIITGTKGQFMKYLEDLENKDIKRLHGTKEPDKWFINDDNIFIVEIKFQQGNGSVAEKLQTPEKKIRNLERRYPNKKVHYIYGLSEWFKNKCSAEIDDLIEDKIPHFWADDKNFKNNIVDYIINNS
jgi:hypothetical protein